MEKTIRNLLIVFTMGMLLAGTGAVVSDAKTIRITPAVQKGKTRTIYTVKKKKGKTAIKKITAKTSDKSVASVKVARVSGGKKYCVKVIGKMIGSVDVKVKVQKKLASGNVKTSTLWFSTDVWGDKKQMAKEAFELQNTIRKKEGQKELEWSEELWKLATLRGDKDGFDKHKNLFSRTDEYFCMNGIITDLWLAENLYQGSVYPTSAIEAWKNSPGHYRVMIESRWQCGAIAYSEKNNTWVAIFSEKPLSAIENWRTKTPLLRVRRIDNSTGEEICGSVIRIVDDAGNEVYRTDVKKEKTNNYYIFELGTFTVGKTYTVIEISAPLGYKKAASVTFVAKGADEGVIEIVLSSDKR